MLTNKGRMQSSLRLSEMEMLFRISNMFKRLKGIDALMNSAIEEAGSRLASEMGLSSKPLDLVP